MTPRHPANLALLVALCLPGAPLAADIVISPPAAGGVAITNAAGNATRLRVADDGTVTLPGLTALPVAGTGLCIDAATGRIGSCPTGGGGSGGTVTSIIAGTGLAGGTITTSGTIGIANGGVGTTQLADGSVTLAKIAANGCTNGQVLRFNGAGWACATIATGAGTVTSVATGAGLTGGPITASGTIALATTQLLPTTACAANQVPKWNGSAWACAADATGTLNGFVQGGNAFGSVAVLGTTDNQPVEIMVNGNRAFRVEPDALAPNVVLGSSANTVTPGAGGGTIGGGGTTSSMVEFELGAFGCFEGCANRVTDRGGTVGGGFGNRAGDSAGAAISRLAPTVGGGLSNRASGNFSAVLGGHANEASGQASVVTGGRTNFAGGYVSFIGSGVNNFASGDAGTVGGGESNSATAVWSTVPGGYLNFAGGTFSFAAGNRASATHEGAFVWGDSFPEFFASAGPNTFNVRSTGGVRFVTAIDGAGTPTRTFTLDASGNFAIPADGAIFRGASRFAHAFGTENTFVGNSAGNFATTGIGKNVGVGQEALVALTDGFDNSALGRSALLANTSGAGNTAVGYLSLGSNTASFNSTAVGAQALVNSTGTFNIALGAFSGFNITTGNNNIAIGNVGVAGDSETMRLGAAQSRAFIAGVRGVTTGINNAVAVFVDSDGQLGTASSSRRVKEAIADMGEASEALMQLRPVSFHYRSHLASGQASRQYGLIAEEVAQVAPELVAHAADGSIETVNYHFLAPMLVNEVQKQHRTIEAQREEIAALRAEMADVKRALGLSQ